MIYSLVISALVAAFGLSTSEAGAIGSVTLCLSAFGGIVAGTVADSIVQVRTLAIAVAVYSLFTFLSGLATSYPEVLRRGTSDA